MGNEYDFHEHICKTIECYVDDIVVKSHDKSDHLADLKRVFDIKWAHQLKMNPTKSFLGVSSGKFLGFVVTSRGIHLDLEKICAIKEMQPPRNLRKFKGLQGQLAYIWRFISHFLGRCQPSPNWWRRESYYFGTMLASKRSRKSNNISCACSCSSNIRKTLLDICSSYESFSRSSASPE